MINHIVEITINNKKLKALCYEINGIVYYGNIKKDDYHGEVKVLKKVEID
jgi:hypothetical protein